MHMAMSMRNFTLSRLFAFAALAALWLAAPQALAQNNPPGGATPRPGQGATSGASPSSLLPAPVEAGQGGLYLAAVFSAADTQPIASGLTWRIYADRPDADGIHKLVAESKDATPALALPEGDYIVHVALGLAGAMKRVTLRGEGLSERLALNAGGLRIAGVLGETAIPAAQLSISIFVPERGNAEAKLVLAKARPNDIISLPEGTYHVVSTLLDTVGVGSTGGAGASPPTNSIVTADLRVSPGKLTDATLRHRAATMTLKLVGQRGGEALANTSFSVLTPGGDVIRELIGAFPSLVLAEGEYVAIARHDSRTYQAVFKVQSTLDRDVEVIAQ
mgnify:CR=1 FL=1